MSLFRRGHWVVEVFQQHGEGGVLDLKFGAGQGAALAGRAVEGVRVLEFLGEAEELERGVDLAGEIGDFGWEHGCVGDLRRLPRDADFGYGWDCMSHDCGVIMRIGSAKSVLAKAWRKG